MTYVKICGLRTPADVAAARAAGADAIGVVVLSTSVRALTPAEAAPVVDAARGELTTVMVVKGPPIDEAIAVARDLGVDVLQLHGYTEADTRLAVAELPEVWRATSVTRGPNVVGAYGEAALLLDSATPGSGVQWDLDLLGEPPAGRWLLAGGLDPDNVAAAIESVRPWGVDVSSGVESEPGVKDHERIRRFVAAARRTAS